MSCAASSAQASIRRRPVADVMTRHVHTIPPEFDHRADDGALRRDALPAHPVVESGQLKGLISIGDISRWMADAVKGEADHLKNYIAGGFPSLAPGPRRPSVRGENARRV
jgi:CBS domain-containing protein